jgi:ATP-dependent exoDNAse (exonuclease V) beta subunit
MSTSAPTPTFPRELVLASAGSGKTYHLSSRIIELLAAGSPPSEILASTFTRKAAGEILDRVLIRLAEGADDAERAKELGRDAHPRLSNPAECRTLLAQLLTDLHQMNVGTLDAFFIRVARSFFQELGLAPGWTITDQPTEDRLRTEAVQAALAEADKPEFVELLRMVNRGAATRTVHGDLVEKVDDLLRIRRQLDPTAMDPWSPDFGVKEQLTRTEIQEEAMKLADRLLKLDVPLNKDGTPPKAWVTAQDDGANHIAARNWTTVFDKGLGLKILDEQDKYSGKLITSDFAEVFQEAVQLARIDLAPKLRRECEALGRLAELLETAFEDAQRRMGAYRFEDVTYMLGGPDPAGSRDDLHYRLDQQVRHILLDEFQDTSLEQWRALSPLADELLSGHLEERAGVIVADPKQSIYGWRGARPEMVHQVGERYGLNGDTMNTSWRSSTVVLDFVADVFRDLPSNAALSNIDVGPRVASEWMQDFTELKAAKELPGHVRVHLAPADERRGAIQPNLLRRAAEVVRDLHQQMPGRSIGVLVRRNKVLGHLMNALHDLGVNASGEGGTPLTDTPPVNALLSLLQLADHPLSGAARYHVACSPLGEVVGFSDHRNLSSARTLADRVRAKLVADGYGPTLAAWIQDLAPRCNPQEVRRLLQLVELGHRWDERPTLRPSDFARYVAREAVEDPSSARVQVMTVHRSKGLEFDVVVLPELYASMSPKGRGVVTPERDPDTGLVVQVYPRVPKSLQALFPEVAAPDRELQAAEFRDGLSVLYVALTRARYALHLVVPPEGGEAKSSAAVIRSALSLDDASVGEDGVLLERGEAGWFDQLGKQSEAVEPKPNDEPHVSDGPLLRPAAKGPGRNLARRSPSSMEGGSGVDLAFHLKLDAGAALLRGSVVHAWCEEIEWIEDGVPDDAALLAVAHDVAPGMSADDLSGLIRDFRGWIETEEIRQALSRDAHTADGGTMLRVEKELPFVRRVGEEIQEGFIDRVVLIERDGRVVAATVLDFKTDAIGTDNAAELAERTEHYRPQIDAYCDVVRERFGLARGDVVGKLLFLAAGVVGQVV